MASLRLRAAGAAALVVTFGVVGAAVATRESPEDRAAQKGDSTKAALVVTPLASALGGADVSAAELAPSGALALGTDRGELWLSSKGAVAKVKRRVIRAADGSPITRLAFSPDSRNLVALTATGWLWTWRAGSPVATSLRIEPSVFEEMDALDRDVSAIAVSPGGRYVAVAAFNVVLFDLERGSLTVFEQELSPESYGGESRVGAPYDTVAVAHDTVVAANVSGVDTWRVSGGRERAVFTCGCDAITATASRDGRYVTYAAGDGHQLVFDVRTKKLLADKTISPEFSVRGAATSVPPRLAAGGREPAAVMIWSTAESTSLGVAKLTDLPRRLAMSGDGRTVLAESESRRWLVELR